MPKSKLSTDYASPTRDEITAFAQEICERQELGNLLMADADLFFERIGLDGSDPVDDKEKYFSRRMLVRLLITLLEGQSWDSFEIVERYATLIRNEDLIHETKNLKETKKRLPIHIFVRHAFDSYRQHIAGVEKSPVSEETWDYLARSRPIRNRITHPKQLSDCIISDDEIQYVLQGPMAILGAWGLLEVRAVKRNWLGKLQCFTHATPPLKRNDVCPCGSGKKFKLCHGRRE